jgi:hypothetical protein
MLTQRTGAIVSELPINRHEGFCVEIASRADKPVVVLSRWKTTPTGKQRTGQCFPFGGHRLAVIQKLLAEAETRVAHFATDAEAVNEASQKPKHYRSSRLACGP